MIKAETITKISMWSIKHPVLVKSLWILFFPITFPIGYLADRFTTFIIYKGLERSQNSEHVTYKICSEYLRYKAERNKWKAKISIKWFGKIMLRHSKKLYEQAIKDKEKINFNFFM